MYEHYIRAASACLEKAVKGCDDYHTRAALLHEAIDHCRKARIDCVNNWHIYLPSGERSDKVLQKIREHTKEKGIKMGAFVSQIVSKEYQSQSECESGSQSKYPSEHQS